METAVWLSEAVEKVWPLRVGMVVLRSMSFVNTPPSVSMPRERGVTSRRSTSLTSPPRIPPWMEAPTATTSSGLTPLLPSLPKMSFTMACTAGMRVEPPTRMTWSMSLGVRPASRSACRQGPRVFSKSVVEELLQLGAAQGVVQVPGSGLVGRDERQIDGGGLRAGELDLGLLRCLLEPLQGHAVLRQVDARSPS